MNILYAYNLGNIQFAGGFDAETIQAFKELKKVGLNGSTQ